MKIHADHDRCEGHGLCVERAPAVFDLDDAGDLVLLTDGDVPADQEQAASRAVDACPVAALSRA